LCFQNKSKKSKYSYLVNYFGKYHSVSSHKCCKVDIKRCWNSSTTIYMYFLLLVISSSNSPLDSPCVWIVLIWYRKLGYIYVMQIYSKIFAWKKLYLLFLRLLISTTHYLFITVHSFVVVRTILSLQIQSSIKEYNMD
jgi:hypothetical protein